MAQLAEQLLLTPETLGSNQVISKFYICTVNLFCKEKYHCMLVRMFYRIGFNQTSFASFYVAMQLNTKPYSDAPSLEVSE